MNKTDFCNKLTSLNGKITSNKTKHLEVQKKLDSLRTKDYMFLSGRIYFTSTFSKHICLLTNTWYNRIKKVKGTDYVLRWKRNGLVNSKIKPLYTAILNSIILKLRHYILLSWITKFDKEPLAVEQNNYLTKAVNAYIVYDLDASPRKPTNKFLI